MSSSRRLARARRSTAKQAVLIVVAVLFGFPLVWMVLTSLKTNPQALARYCQDLWIGRSALPIFVLSDHLLRVDMAGAVAAKCSGASSSLTAIAPSQHGHRPPGPSRRAQVLQSSQRCSPRNLASQLGHW
jgi:ABC-type glycerol-3-phosphate transport system permease component